MTTATISPTASAPASRVPLKDKISYGIGMYGISLVQISVGALLLYYYTDVYGITAQLAGLIIFCGTLLDAFGELAVAAISSRTNGRFGKYRPFLIFGAVPLGLTFILMFIKPDLPPSQLLIVAFASHLLFRAAYAVVSMPHASLIGRLSTDANERASIGGVKAMWSSFGTLTASWLGLSVVQYLGDGDDARGFFIFSVMFGIASATALLICGLFTRERVDKDVDRHDTIDFFKAAALTAKNAPFVVFLAGTLTFFIGYMLWYSSVVYYFKYYLSTATDARTAFLCIALGGVIGPFLWMPFIRAASKAQAWTAGCILIAAMQIALYLAGVQPLWVIAAIYFLMGIGKCAVIMNYFAMVADAVDYGHWKSGVRVEAYSFGMLSLLTKSGMAIGGGLLGLLLGYIGFEAADSLPEAVQANLRLVACASPAVVIVISGLIMTQFRVSASQLKDMRADIAKRAGAAS